MNDDSPNPYVGPRTFQSTESHLFHGRDRESRDLLSLVLSDPLVLFYAQSGAGKSSLVNTRLIPRLEAKNFEVLRVGRVGGESQAGMEVENIFVFNLLGSLIQQDMNVYTQARIRLDQFLAGLGKNEDGYFYDEISLNLMQDEFLPRQRRALIIDQFEEIFSMHPEAWQKREDFFIQVAQAMESDPLLWVVLVMREDYIAYLDPYAHLLPNGLRVRYYMQRLSREAAIEAMKKPVEKTRPYAEGVAEKLVENLASIKVPRPDGGQDVQPGQYVEPVQLQVVCYSLWEHLSPGGTEITEQDLLEVGDVDQSLERYYESRISSVAVQKSVPERLIREWFETDLITQSGTRNIVLQKRNSDGLQDDVIQILQGDLVRAEVRAGQVWYELSHDRLIEPVRKNNREWFEKNLSLFERQSALWNQQGRSEGLLLRGKELDKAEKDVKALTLTSDEQAFLVACRALQKREQRDLAQRRIIFGALVFSILLLILAGLFWQQAQVSATEAIQNAATAQAASTLAVANEQAALQAGEKARQAGEEANLAREQAVKAQQITESTLKKTEIELRKARNQALSAQAELLGNDAPSTSILLALEAIKLNQDAGEPISQVSYQALRNALSNTQGIPVNGNSEAILVMDYSSNGDWFATGGKDGQVRVWEVRQSRVAGDPTYTLDCDQGEVQYLFFSNDGSRLASAGNEPVVCAWDMSASAPSQTERRMEVDLPAMDDFTVSPNGKLAAAGSTETNEMVVLDLEKGQAFEKAQITDNSVNEPMRLAFNPESSSLLVANDYAIEFWVMKPTGPVKVPGGGIFPIPDEKGPQYLHIHELMYTPKGNRIIGLGYTGEPYYGDSLFFLLSGGFLKNPEYIELPGTIQHISISPNERWLAGANNNTIWVWDLKQGSNVLRLDGHQAPVNALEFSSDGRWLASSTGAIPGASNAQGDGTVRLWDLAADNPAESAIVIPASLDGNLLAFDSQNKWLTISSENRLVRLFDLTTKLFSIDPLEFSETSAVALSASEVPNNKGSVRYKFSPMLANPNISWIVPHAGVEYISEGNKVLKDLYSVSKMIAVPPSILANIGPGARIYGVRSDGKHLVYGVCDDQGLNCKIFEIDMSLGDSAPAQPLFPDDVTSLPILKVDFTPDNRWMAIVYSSANDAFLYESGFYLVNVEDKPYRFGPQNRFTGELDGLSDRWVFSNDEKGSTLMDLNDPEPVKNLKYLPGITSLATSPDGRWLVNTISDNNHLGLFDLNQIGKGVVLKSTDLKIPVSRQSKENAYFSADSRWLLVSQCPTQECNTDTNFYLWDLTKPDPASARKDIPMDRIEYDELGNLLTQGIWSPDRKWLGLQDAAGNVTLLDLSGEELVIKDFLSDAPAGGFAALAFSPDSRWFATVDKQGTASLYDLSGERDGLLIPNRSLYALVSINFSGDEDNILLAGGTANGRILLWNLEELLQDPETSPTVLQGGERAYDRIYFTPDNRWILAHGEKEPLKAWRVLAEDVLEFACEVAGRNLSLDEWIRYGFTEEYRATCAERQVDARTSPSP